jgi:hypothetical protein
MINDQCELPALEVGPEMIHAPDGSLLHQQKWCVVVFMLMHLMAGICSGVHLG